MPHPERVQIQAISGHEILVIVVVVDVCLDLSLVDFDAMGGCVAISRSAILLGGPVDGASLGQVDSV